jgi:hypothetical protein
VRRLRGLGRFTRRYFSIKPPSRVSRAPPQPRHVTYLSKAAGASTLTTLYFAPQCGLSISDGGGFDITANMSTKIPEMKPDNTQQRVATCHPKTSSLIGCAIRQLTENHTHRLFIPVSEQAELSGRPWCHLLDLLRQLMGIFDRPSTLMSARSLIGPLPTTFAV